MPARDAVWSVSAGTVVPSGAISSGGAVAEAMVGELLALGSHGLDTTSSLLLGSTSARTTTLADFPVILVRPAGPAPESPAGAVVAAARQSCLTVLGHRLRPAAGPRLGAVAHAAVCDAAGPVVLVPDA